jgi:hypothetical protein
MGRVRILGGVLKEGLKTRQDHSETFHQRHPIIKAANKITHKPLKTIGGSLTEKEAMRGESLETIHTCHEAGEPETHTCDTFPLFTQRFFEVKRYVNTSIWGHIFRRYSVGGNPQYTNPYTRGLGHDHGYNLTVVNETLTATNWRYHDGCNWYDHTVRPNYESYTDFEIVESEQEGCAALEALVDDQRCVYHTQRCVEGPETRMIFGRPIVKDCWRRRRTYLCGSAVSSSCAPFKVRGCEQRSVICERRVGDRCGLYRKTFICRSNRYQSGKTRITGPVPFCLDGNCAAHKVDGNKDFADSISKLSIFRDMGKEFESGAVPSAFKGTLRRCSRSLLNFQDCCGSGQGWGKSLKLADACSAEERVLQTDRKNNRCVYVGTHCVEKEPATHRCLKKKSTYCCFGSKIGKILQEQGRAQLGLGWGDSQKPQCRALSIDELQRLDFDRFDMSALFEDIKTNRSSVTGATETLLKEWSSKMEATPIDDKKPDPEGGMGRRVF